MEQVGLKDEDVVEMPIIDLNRHLKSRGIDKKSRKCVTMWRRTLKNR
jgi:hypothetical protein